MTSHPLEGVTRVIIATTVSTGAGDTDVDLRPASGRVWEVLFARAYQNDGAVAQKWLFTDPDASDQEISGITATAAWVSFMLGCNSENAASSPFIAPPILSYNRYFTYRFTASAITKTGWIVAMVKEYRGIAAEV